MARPYGLCAIGSVRCRLSGSAAVKSVDGMLERLRHLTTLGHPCAKGREIAVSEA